MKRILLFVIIFLGIFAVYIAAHVQLYYSISNFFNIASKRANVFLIEALVFLGGSFLLATFLAHLKDNVFTRVYYFLAASWLGILTNLFIFFTLAWLIIFIGGQIHFQINRFGIGTVAIVLAIMYSIYGAWNAFTPRIKDIQVSIDNLPQFWMGKKIVLISDAHFGNIFTERYAFDLATKINSMKPDLILISGDLFDGTDERLDTFIAPLNTLEAPMGIFFVTGNHETYLEEDIGSIIARTKITQLKDELRDVEGLQIVGIDYPPRAEHKDVSQTIRKMTAFDQAKPSILLWHTPTQIQEIKKTGISLQLSGHTHKGQLFPFGLITKAVYMGYDYGLKREGSFAIYTSSGLGGWGPPIRTEKSSEIVQITLR